MQTKNNLLLISGIRKDVISTVEAILTARGVNGLTAKNIGQAEVDGDRFGVGINLDGHAVEAMTDPKQHAVLVPNYSRSKALRDDGKRYGLMVLNVEIEGDFDLEVMLTDNKKGLAGLDQFFAVNGIPSNVAAVLDGPFRTQRTLMFTINDDGTAMEGGSSISELEIDGDPIVDFAENSGAFDIVSATSLATFDGLKTVKKVNFNEVGINHPARRITTAPDGTKVVTFVDFALNQAYTATFDTEYKMIGTLTEVEGAFLRINESTATYQMTNGKAFGQTPWVTPTTPA